MKEKRTKITFEYSDRKRTCVLVKRDNKKIGRIWSYDSDTPYPHDDSAYCQNSIQICGFDRISEVWGCGPFPGKKDCVVHFLPMDIEYYKEKSKEYTRYVKEFFESEVKVLSSGVGKFTIAQVNKRDDKDITKLLSFNDWVRTIGAL